MLVLADIIEKRAADATTQAPATPAAAPATTTPAATTPQNGDFFNNFSLSPSWRNALIGAAGFGLLSSMLTTRQRKEEPDEEISRRRWWNGILGALIGGGLLYGGTKLYNWWNDPKNEGKKRLIKAYFTPNAKNPDGSNKTAYQLIMEERQRKQQQQQVTTP